MKKQLFILTLVASMIVMLSTASTHKENKNSNLAYVLNAGEKIEYFCNIDQVSVIEKSLLTNVQHCLCHGPKFMTGAPHYGQWAWECVAGGTPFYTYGVGFPPPSTPIYMPMPPCQTSI